ncbi:MAG: energy-coupling factor transporter ATPase [Coriobacteriia bacterium]|nr:energy-coupling factor transporter ATPase [Coriobacteriia bacterium]
MIVFEQTGFSYPGSVVPAVHDVSVTVEPGVLVALLGANGSGKSTLARLVNALLVPSTGSVFVDDMDTRDEDAVWSIRSRVGFIQQNPENQIVGTIAEEDVAFGPENLGVPPEEIRLRVDEALDAVGLAGFQRREPHMLSGGQKQRLAIAGALAMRPAYLVADEPTAMLDPVGRADVLSALRDLRSRGVGVVHITHHLADVLDADRVIVLSSGGTVFDGTPAELIEDPGRALRMGIELPAEVLLADELRRGGVSLPGGRLDPVELVEALWRS